ncbi:alpha/beta fold hydrolase [Streptomyces sp. NPDC093064]|uniref:alpha/beta fold hydrolase n=1 Tax=Streptomyces sp. NPDC093064 TaxID=3366020 RepID=UPI003826DEA1
MPHITIGHDISGAIELHYEDRGTGQPVVLVHGYPLDSRSWDKQVPTLLAAGYRVITYDRRGFGRSSPAADGYDYDTLAADLNSVLAELDLGDAVLVGHAAGTGEIARYLGTHGSARVAKAVFLASLPPFLLRTDGTPHGVDLTFFDELMAKARSLDRRAYFAELCDLFLNTDKPAGTESGDSAAETFLDIASATSPRACVAVIPAWITDFRADIASIDAPTLIVHGSRDRLLPVDATGRPLHALLPQATYVEIPDAPHGLLWTHAEEINKAVLAFLADTKPRT